MCLNAFTKTYVCFAVAHDESEDALNYGLTANGTCPDGHFLCQMTLNCVPVSGTFMHYYLCKLHFIQ
jgi:hypothetical protein